MGPIDAVAQHDSSAANIAKDTPESSSREVVAALIESGKYAECLRLLDEPGQHSTTSRSCTLRLICQTCLRAQDGQWPQVDALENPTCKIESVSGSPANVIEQQTGYQ